MRMLISIILWTIGISLTILLFFAMLFFTVALFPFDKKRKAAHAQCYWWSYILTNINPFWKVRVNGLENIDHRRTYVIVVNHQSLADIIVLYRTKMQFKWVAKEDLFKVPFIGWCLSLAKHISLSRGDFSSVKKVYRESAGWLRNGMSVLFFPEGTRSKTDRMKEFHNGAFRIALKERKPILPIVISGTGQTIAKGSWLFAPKVRCSLQVLPPIDTSRYKMNEFERLMEATKAELETALSLS